MNMVRYVVFHVEQSHGFRVLKMVIEFMTDINGQYYLKAVPKLYCSSVYPWILRNWVPTHQVDVTKSDFEGSTAWFPDACGGTLLEEQLESTWEALTGPPNAFRTALTRTSPMELHMLVRVESSLSYVD